MDLADYELDQAVRQAAFRHIQALAERQAGVVTSRQMVDGFEFRGQRVAMWNQASGIFRPTMLPRGSAALTIVTTPGNPYDENPDPSDDRLIYRYRGTDPLFRDNVLLRRAMEQQRPLLYFVGLRPGVYQPVFPVWVIGDVPEALSFMLVVDEAGSIAELRPPVPDEWPEKRYITRAVKQRLHQQEFRVLVLHAYDEQCSMCRLRHVPLLDAAHILPDADTRGRPEVPNGLALCKIHHSAYDIGIVGVDPDYAIHVRRDVLEEHDGPMLRHGLQELHGGRLALPRSPRNRPNREYLAERFERFRVA
jgi:putative restriction endonuclease